MGRSLLQKVWDLHTVGQLPDGRTQLFVGLHLIHEVTSPQAFSMLREAGLAVAYPARTVATVDHIIPTHTRQRPFADDLAEVMLEELQKNTNEFGIRFFDLASKKQGIVHIVAPEQGLTQPGMTICCGDSHTSTHGAFGAIAFGIGTSQVRDVLATQTVAMSPLQLRRVEINGAFGPGVCSKDAILHVIRSLGVRAGVGFAYEYGGSVIEALSMDERMTICNMSVEGGARIGYVNPDETTFDYLKNRPFSPSADCWGRAEQFWRSVASDANCSYDDVVTFDASTISPMVTWGVNPGQAVSIDEPIPRLSDLEKCDRATHQEALEYMSLEAGRDMKGTPVDVAFIGSCTNGRISDIRLVAQAVRGKTVNQRVRAILVPGSQEVAQQAQKEGLADALIEAGFEWRQPGCSMCLAMNPDKLVGDQLCASSSNRNFKGRQGSPNGRTVLMSPLMVAAAAICGEISDAREVFDVAPLQAEAAAARRE